MNNLPPFHIVIPARYGSTRLAAKALVDIDGKAMILHVAEQAQKCEPTSLTVATDDERIQHLLQQHGFATMLTAASHNSGTERIAEVVQRLNFSDHTLVLNVQGDEPFIGHKLMREVVTALAQNPDAAIATACYAIHDRNDFQNPDVVKVVRNAQNEALYFSRAPIPYPRAEAQTVYRHIGLYAYRVGFLKAYTQLPATSLEAVEGLEQLRALYYGYRIVVTETAHPPPAGGVDNAADLARARALFETGYRVEGSD